MDHTEIEALYREYQEIAAGDDTAAAKFLKEKFPTLSPEAQATLMAHVLTSAMKDIADERDTKTEVREEVLDEVLRALKERDQNHEA